MIHSQMWYSVLACLVVLPSLAKLLARFGDDKDKLTFAEHWSPFMETILQESQFNFGSFAQFLGIISSGTSTISDPVDSPNFSSFGIVYHRFPPNIIRGLDARGLGHQLARQCNFKICHDGSDAREQDRNPQRPSEAGLIQDEDTSHRWNRFCRDNGGKFRLAIHMIHFHRMSPSEFRGRRRP